MSQQTVLRVQTNIDSLVSVTGTTTISSTNQYWTSFTGSGTQASPFAFSTDSNGNFTIRPIGGPGSIFLDFTQVVEGRQSLQDLTIVEIYEGAYPGSEQLNEYIYAGEVNSLRFTIEDGQTLRLRTQMSFSGDSMSGTVYFLPDESAINYTPKQYDTLDLYGDIPIKINKSFAELQDIGKKNSDFSVNLKLPGSKKNNRFFETYYNVDSSLLYFDVSQRVNCNVLIEDQSYFSGYLKLNRIAVLNSKVEYDVTLYSTVSDLFGQIGNNLLKDLDFNDSEFHFNHPFSYRTILATYGLNDGWRDSTYSSGYFYPILHNGYNYDGDNVILSGGTTSDLTRLYTTSGPIGGYSTISNWYTAGGKRWRINSPADGIIANQLKPALSIENLIRLMFKNYGYSIKSDFFKTPWFRSLFLYGYFSSPETKLTYMWEPGNCLPELGCDVLVDDSNGLLYVVKTGTLVPATSCQPLTGALRLSDDEGYGYTYETFVIPAGSYSIPLESYAGYTFEGIEMYNFNNWYFGIPAFDPATQTGQPYPIQDNDYVNLSLIIDQKFKQIDLLSSIAKKFNLVFVPDPDYPNQIIIEPYDYYIGTGDIHDWTPKLSYDKGFTVEPAQNFVESNLLLTDQEDGDDGNKVFKDANNRLYGEKNIYNPTDFKSTEKKIDTIFSPELIRNWDDRVGIPLGINYVGSSTENDGGDISYQYKGIKSKPKLFFNLGSLSPFVDQLGEVYNLGNVNTNIIRIAPTDAVTPLTGTTEQMGSLVVPGISHTTSLGNPDDNKIINDSLCILFGSEVPVDLGVQTFDSYSTQDVYTRFYQNRITNIYDKNTRFLSGFFDLKLPDVQNLKPNDLIKINEQYFIWNKVSEYNLTNSDLTKAELIQTNRVYNTYPDRYFIYAYCDDPFDRSYKWKTYFNPTEAYEAGEISLNASKTIKATNYYWSSLFDYFIGILGGNVQQLVMGLDNGYGSYWAIEVREVTKLEYDTAYGIETWNNDPNKWYYLGYSKSKPLGIGYDEYPVLLNGTTGTALNVAADCDSFTTLMTSIGVTVSPAPPIPTGDAPTPTATTPLPTPTPTPQFSGDGSLILTYDRGDTENYLEIYTGTPPVKKRLTRYDSVTNLYTTFLNDGEFIIIVIKNPSVTPYATNYEMIRRDYTNDDQNGNMGIVDTPVSLILSEIGPNEIQLDCVVDTNPDAYNFEYRLSLTVGDAPTPTPTPPPIMVDPTYFGYWAGDYSDPINGVLPRQIVVPLNNFTSPLSIGMTIDWGDGNIDYAVTEENPTHYYDVKGFYEVKVYWYDTLISANLGNYNGPDDKLNGWTNWNVGLDLSCVQGISDWGDTNLYALISLFAQDKNTNNYLPDYLPTTVLYLGSAFYKTTRNNTDITTWDVSNVTSMKDMFQGSSFNRNINGWDVSSVLDMRGMFEDNTVFNSPLNLWNPTSVTKMGLMFSGAYAFNQDISGWDVSSVVEMPSMFKYATAFNQDIGGWDVSNVEQMTAMFWWATSFNQDLSGWCVTNISSKPALFDTNTTSWTLPASRPIWGTCP